MTESAKAFHRIRKHRGHFWERRYHACLVDEDTYALAALRYLDRNPAWTTHRPVGSPAFVARYISHRGRPKKFIDPLIESSS